MSPAEVLLRAADRVQFEGWVQSTFAEDADGKITSSKSPNAVKWCARGAMKSVSPSTWQMEQAYGALDDHLCSIRGGSWPHGPMAWNDAPGRTAGEVADTMRRVAKELSNGAAA